MGYAVIVIQINLDDSDHSSVNTYHSLVSALIEYNERVTTMDEDANMKRCRVILMRNDGKILRSDGTERDG